MPPHSCEYVRLRIELIALFDAWRSSQLGDTTDPPSPPAAAWARPIITSDLSKNRTRTNLGESATDPIDFVAYNKMLYANGEPFDLKGVNWFGSESRTGPPSGLARHSLGFYLDFLQFHGFNAIRLLFNHQSVLRNGVVEENELIQVCGLVDSALAELSRKTTHSTSSPSPPSGARAARALLPRNVPCDR